VGEGLADGVVGLAGNTVPWPLGDVGAGSGVPEHPAIASINPTLTTAPRVPTFRNRSLARSTVRLRCPLRSAMARR
jgi:hypothetical protein